MQIHALSCSRLSESSVDEASLERGLSFASNMLRVWKWCALGSAFLTLCRGRVNEEINQTGSCYAFFFFWLFLIGVSIKTVGA